MAIIVGILGESGSGKSSSYRNADPDRSYIINADSKALPFHFRDKFNAERKNYIVTSDIDYISDKILPKLATRLDIKELYIDTVNALMIDKEMSASFRNRKMGSEAMNKWMDLAAGVYYLISELNKLRDDLIVYIFGHTCEDEGGFRKLVTNGRKLEKIKLESKMPIVLHTHVKCDGKGNNEYFLETKMNNSTAKTPIGMFEEFLIPNDITIINEKVREYYGTN